MRAFQRTTLRREVPLTSTPFSPCVSVKCGEASDFWPQILPAGVLSLIPYAALDSAFLLLFLADLLLLPRRRSVWRAPTALRRRRTACDLHRETDSR